MKKTIRDFNLKNKKVIIRCDFNVPIDDGVITSDFRLRSSVKTIKYAMNKGAKVILLSHLGRVKTEEDKEKYSLSIVIGKLSLLLDKEVIFAEDIESAKKKIKKMKYKDVLLLENTRFADLDGNRESGNDPEFAKELASLGDIFIDDAFAVSHRAHASNVGITNYLPSGIGYLMEKEIKTLRSLNRARKPYVVILGGAKVSDKLPLIDHLAKKADYVLIGGGMAFTFLEASGFSIGSSLVDRDLEEKCIKLLSDYESKIILPIDIRVGYSLDDTSSKLKFINEIEEDEIGLDIGPQTVKLFKQYLKDAKTIFWNGPLGYFENETFSDGTKDILKYMSSLEAKTIIGGGDSASAAINLGYEDKITHISTGGGASLAYVEGKSLPGLDAIEEKN